MEAHSYIYIYTGDYHTNLRSSFSSNYSKAQTNIHVSPYCPWFPLSHRVVTVVCDTYNVTIASDKLLVFENYICW